MHAQVQHALRVTLPQSTAHQPYCRQVLRSLGQNYKSISPVDSVFRDALVVLSIGLAFKLAASAVIVRNTSRSSRILPVLAAPREPPAQLV